MRMSHTDMYDVVIEKTQLRKLKTLPTNTQTRIQEACDELKQSRSPTDHSKCKPLKGQKGLFRMRVGHIRLIMDKQHGELRIHQLGDREGIYADVDDYEVNA